MKFYYLLKFLILGATLCSMMLVLSAHSQNFQGLVYFQSYNYPDLYIRHRDGLGYIESANDDLARQDITFRIVLGLADRNCNSFESVNFPNHFLRHQNFRLNLSESVDEQLFREDATFCIVPGLFDNNGYSFKSFNFPTHYIRHRNFQLWLDAPDGSDLFRKDATFIFTTPFETAQNNVDFEKPPPLHSFQGLASFQSYNYPDLYMRHRDGLGYIESANDDPTRQDITFRIVPGLADRNCNSFESVNFPNHFLRHQDFRLRLSKSLNDQLFREDATFCIVPGLFDSNGYSFKSFNFPTHYIRHRNFQLWLDAPDGSDLFRKDATFTFITAQNNADFGEQASPLGQGYTVEDCSLQEVRTINAAHGSCSFKIDFEQDDGLAVGDVNGDGIAEIVHGDRDDWIRVYNMRGNKLGEFPVDFEQDDGLAVGDVNGDGIAEVIHGDRDDWIRVYDMRGNKLREFPVDFEQDDGLTVGDVNGDGASEIIHGDRDDGIIIFW